MSKRTLATTIRCDARQAAELVLFFNSREVKIDNISDLLRRTIDTLVMIAIKNGLTRTVETTEEAIEILRSEGVIDLTKERKNRNFFSLVKELEQESLILDIKEPEEPQGLFVPTKEMQEELQRRLKKGKEEKKGLVEQTPNVVEEDDET